MLIDIPIFSGARPLVDPRLLEPTQAQVADNCLVSSGALKSLRRMRPEARLPRGVQDFLLYDGQWVPFYEEVSVCRSTVNADAQGRMYYTGKTSGAMMFRRALGGGASSAVKLGVPQPEATPTAVVQGTGDEAAIYTTYYLYTLVTDLGEESAPSPASGVIDVRTGQGVLVQNLALPDMAGRNPVVSKRLYRGNSGTKETKEQLVAELPASAVSYLDTVLSSALGEALVTEGWLPPPDGLQGLTALRGGSLAGFLGNKVYISEPFAPYAWPRKYVQSLEHNVAAIAATGGFLAVLTDASAYLVPCDDVTATAPTRLEGYTPCAGPRGVASMRQGVVFPGVDGLYLVAGGSTTAQHLTAGIIAPDEWEALRPASFRAFGLGDRYICFYEDAEGARGGFVFDMASPSYLLGLGLHATCGWLEPEGRKLHLGYERDGRTSVALWEGEEAVYSAQWRSKVFRFPAPLRMAAARVEGDFPEILTQEQHEAMRAALAASFADEIAKGELGGQLGTSRCGTVRFAGDILDGLLAPYSEEPLLTFQLFADGREVYRRNITKSAPFTLPPVSGAEWEVCISGAVKIHRICLATSMAELRAG